MKTGGSQKHCYLENDDSSGSSKTVGELTCCCYDTALHSYAWSCIIEKTSSRSALFIPHWGNWVAALWCVHKLLDMSIKTKKLKTYTTTKMTWLLKKDIKSEKQKKWMSQEKMRPYFFSILLCCTRNAHWLCVHHVRPDCEICQNRTSRPDW